MRGRLATWVAAVVTAILFYWAAAVLSIRLLATLGATTEGMPMSGAIVGGAAALGLAWHVGQGVAVGARPARAWLGALLGLAAVALWSVCEAIVVTTPTDLASLAIGLPVMLFAGAATLVLGVRWQRLYLKDCASGGRTLNRD